MVWDNKHKYSTYAILVIVIIIGGTIIASSLDTTTATVTSNCTLGYSVISGLKINASDVLNLGVLSANLTPNGIECATGALNSTSIASDGELTGTCRDFPDTFNTTEQIRAAINNSVGYNITITTSTSGSGDTNGTINNLTITDVDNTVTTIICLLNDTCLSDSFTDSTGSYDDSWISPLLADLQTNLTGKGSSNLTYANIVEAVGNFTADKGNYYLDTLGDLLGTNITQLQASNNTQYLQIEALKADNTSKTTNDTTLWTAIVTTRGWEGADNTSLVTNASTLWTTVFNTRAWTGADNTSIRTITTALSADNTSIRLITTNLVTSNTTLQTKVDNVNTTAMAALPKAGGAMTGNITATCFMISTPTANLTVGC